MIITPFLGGYDNNFMYLVHDEETKKALIIDPFSIDELLPIIEAENLEIQYVINTHSHFDHVQGNKQVLAATNARLVSLDENEELVVGNLSIELIPTPGHTPDSRCILINKHALFTGDTLFVGSIGFVNSKQDAINMHDSLNKIMLLPNATLLYPGHHYGETQSSMLGEEKQTNPFLRVCTSRESFLAFLKKK